MDIGHQPLIDNILRRGGDERGSIQAMGRPSLASMTKLKRHARIERDSQLLSS